MPYDAYGNWYDDGGYDASAAPADAGSGGAPPNSMWNDTAGRWDTMAPWSPGYDPTWGGYITGDPWGASTGDQWLKAAGGGASGGGASGGGPSGPSATGSYQDYYTWGGPMAPDLSWLKNAPTFEFADFAAPGVDGMFADPGYQFRLDQGRKALEQSAAGRGTLRTGGTLKDILGYGQNMASQEYGNVYNRALNAYNTNLGTAKERYAPGLASWQNDQAARQNASNRAFDRAWDVYAYSTPSATTIFNAGLS
jgi:hypothetical protein